MVVCAYIAYISRVIIAYILPFEQHSLYLSTLMLQPCDYDVTIKIALLFRVSWKPILHTIILRLSNRDMILVLTKISNHIISMYDLQS